MVDMTRTHGFYSMYTNIQWNNCHFPTELVQMFQLVNVWNFATIHHLLQCSPICFSSTHRWHIVHATLLLTCAHMCRSSLNWPPNSPDLAPVDYAVWGALQQMVYRRKISDIDQLKRVLIDCWAQLSQDTLIRAINQLPKRLMMVIKANRVPTWSFVWTNSVGKWQLFHCMLV